MKLTSSAFEQNGKIPAQYTCDGLNISPPLTISDVPATAKSLVLLMDDPDIPEIAKKNFKVEVWDHFVVFNISPTICEIKEGEKLAGVFGRNTRGNNSYGGPCPPDREHRYFFKLYALDTILTLQEGVSKNDVERAMEGHVIAKAELIGRYERVKR
jgi:Raf kinase inhibitor-like YbhB/YbcL family protein